MAKVCRNCDRKIKLGEKCFRLKETDSYLCASCGRVAGPLLEEMKSEENLEPFREKCRELNRYLKTCTLNKVTLKCIDYEKEYIARKAMKKLNIDYSECMTFEADFEESYHIVHKCLTFGTSTPPVILEIGNTKVANFLMEEATLMRDFQPNVSVTLFHKDGKSYVTALATGERPAENKYVHKFWQNFYVQGGHLDIKPYPVTTMKQRESRAIGVLGGTFDPVHTGHVTLAKSALLQGNLKKLIVMPAHVQPFKLGKDISDDCHRLNMAKLAFEDMAEVEVSDYEINHTDISYTYETLCSLQKQYPDDKIIFIMGTDSFLSLDTWYMGTELLETFAFLVSARPGYRESELEIKIEEFRRRYGTEVEKLMMTMPDISSTEIRAKYEAGLSIAGDVPEAVERYINEHGLYK